MAQVSTPVILCSHFPLPYKGIGSWTTMYNYYLESDNEIDCIVCPTNDAQVATVDYLKIKDGLVFKLQRKTGVKHKYSPYYLAIEKYLKEQPGSVIIHIIDIPLFLINNKQKSCGQMHKP